MGSVRETERISMTSCWLIRQSDGRMALTMSSVMYMLMAPALLYTNAAELAVKADRPIYNMLSFWGGREKAGAENGGSSCFPML